MLLAWRLAADNLEAGARDYDIMVQEIEAEDAARLEAIHKQLDEVRDLHETTIHDTRRILTHL